MQGDQTMNDETGFSAMVKALSVWVVTAVAHFVDTLSVQQVSGWLAIIYTTLLIISWFRREFRTPPRQVRVTDTAETIHAKKAVVVIDEAEFPEPPRRD